MATIGFISHRYLDNYNFEQVIKPEDRTFLIVLESMLSTVPQETCDKFSKIYTIPDNLCSNGPLIKFSYDATKAILCNEKEISNSDKIYLICIDEINMQLAANLREELDLHGPCIDAIAKCQNKTIMKKSLENHNIKIPKYLEIGTDKINAPEEYFEYLIKTLGTKFVLKPQEHTGSFGVYIIDNYHDFLKFCNDKLYLTYAYEANAFIQGELYHTDLVIKDGKAIFAESCLYTYPNHQFANGKIIASLPLTAHDSLRHDLISHGVAVVKALSGPNGAYHIEQFINAEGDIIFLEIAARPAGGLVARMYESNSNVNIFTLDLAVKLNRDIVFNKKSNHYALQALVPYGLDLLKKLNELSFSSHVSFKWIVNTDVSIKKTSGSVVDVAAKLLLESDKYENIHQDFLALKNI